MYLRGMNRDKFLNETLGFADGNGILFQDKDILIFSDVYWQHIVREAFPNDMYILLVPL